MPVINMGQAMDRLLEPVKVKTVIRSSTDFETAKAVTERTQAMVVQPAQRSRLTAEKYDSSLQYLLLHTKRPLVLGEFVEYAGEDFKVIEQASWTTGAYYEALAEQTRRTAMAVT